MKLVAVFITSLFFSFAAQADSLEQVYVTLSEDYINVLTNREITLKGLQALEKTDTNIKVSATDKKLYIYYKRRLAKVFSLPETDNISNAWAALSREAIAAAAKISPKVEILNQNNLQNQQFNFSSSLPIKATANKSKLLGKTLTKSLFGYNNEIIGKKDEKITEKIISRAIKHNKMNFLFFFSK